MASALLKSLARVAERDVEIDLSLDLLEHSKLLKRDYLSFLRNTCYWLTLYFPWPVVITSNTLSAFSVSATRKKRSWHISCWRDDCERGTTPLCTQSRTPPNRCTFWATPLAKRSSTTSGWEEWHCTRQCGRWHHVPSHHVLFRTLQCLRRFFLPDFIVFVSSNIPSHN